MSNVEWPVDVSNNISLPTIVSSSDLFDGEIFGDELINIYNTSVAEGMTDSVHDEIPNLLVPTDNAEDAADHPGVQVAAAAAAIDDGLGSFRPSTSFNDLTALLPPASSETAGGADARKATPASSGDAGKVSPDSSPKNRKKRLASAGAGDAPATKRKATGNKGGKKKVAAANQTKASGSASLTVAVQKTATPNVAASGVVTPGSSSTIKAAPSTGVPPPPLSGPVAGPAVPGTAPVAPTSAPATKGNTDADFKSIAQAAVSNLMLSVGENKTEKPEAASTTTKKKVSKKTGDTKAVDTSTEHVKALTSNNWVAACSEAIGETPAATQASSAAAAADPKNNNRAKRTNLTPDERARQNRDRNREHARNTRLRKKAYVEELKRTLVELVAQRDSADFEKRQSAQRELEQREVRFRVIEEFLKLRGRNEHQTNRWAAILEKAFKFTVPVSDFRKIVQRDPSATYGEHVATDVAEVMADSGNFASFLNSLGTGSDAVAFQYHCDRKNFFMDGCTAVLEWTGTSVGAVKTGAKAELLIKGTIRGKFSPASNKLISASMSFDTGALLGQINKIVQVPGSDGGEETGAAAASAAAQMAASQADAILDSLQMPRLTGAVPAAVNVVPSSSSSECSSDESYSDQDKTARGDNNKDTTVTA